MKATDRLRSSLSGNRTRCRNWLNRRALERGKVPLPDRIKRQFSPLPVYRSRINRATGRPHKDDKHIGAVQDRALARTKAQNDARSARAEHNQRLVRETLARRDPRYAQALERTVRDASPQRPASRAGRSR